jgi:hypothetical protein
MKNGVSGAHSAEGKPENSKCYEKRPLGCLRHKWVGVNIEVYPSEMGCECMQWIELAFSMWSFNPAPSPPSKLLTHSFI